MKKSRTLNIGKYIAILLVIVFAITYVNLWFYSSFKKQAEEVNKYVQDQIIGGISQYYDEIYACAVGTITDDEFFMLQNFSDKEEVYRSNLAINIVKRLRITKSKSSMIDKIYVYIDAFELVLCDSGILSQETFYDIEGKKHFDTYEKWLESVKITNKKKNFLTNDKSIMFSISLNGLYKVGGNKSNIVVGAFSNKKDVFVKTPHIEWINKCNIYVYDRNGNIALCEENIVIDSLPSMPEHTEFIDKKPGYDTLSYDVTIDDSMYNIVVAFEENLNMATVKRVQLVSVLTAIASLLLAAYYFFDLYRKRYKPIKAISSLLGINIDKIDYTLIEKPIENIMKKNQILNHMLENNNANLKFIIFKRLLTGDLSKEFMSDLENLGIKLNKECCFVTVIHLYTDSDITESENTNLINAVKEEINAIIKEKGAAYFVLENKNIVCICNAEKDFDLKGFGESVLDVFRKLENSYEFVASAAISSPHTKYWHYSNAYAEAIDAMSDNELRDKSKVVFYSDKQIKKSDHRFSLEEETKLASAIKNADAVAAGEIIKDAIGRIRPEKSFLYMNVSVGLIYSLMRIADLLFGEEFDTHSIAYLLKNTEDLTLLSNECLEFARKMCEESKKNQADNKIANRVLEYIRNNYSNTQLDARIIADEIGYSFVYINNLFKQEYASTIVAYLNCYRIEKAKELIKLNIPVNEAAKSVGISSVRTFNRQFQSLVGMTPTEYKNNVVKN